MYVAHSPLFTRQWRCEVGSLFFCPQPHLSSLRLSRILSLSLTHPHPQLPHTCFPYTPRPRFLNPSHPFRPSLSFSDRSKRWPTLPSDSTHMHKHTCMYISGDIHSGDISWWLMVRVWYPYGYYLFYCTLFRDFGSFIVCSVPFLFLLVLLRLALIYISHGSRSMQSCWS